MTHPTSPVTATPTLTERRADLPNGIQLSYVAQGSPACVPVVFLHGWSDSWRSFEPLFPHLTDSVHAIALSQRGHGDSSRPEAGYRPADLAADVVAFLDEAHIEAAVIVGHSMGTTVALRVAVDYPDRVLGLVLLGAIRTWQRMIDVDELRTAANVLSDPVDVDFVREFQLGTIAQQVDPAYVDLVVRESLKLPARVWRAVIEDFLPDTTWERIDSITARTLLLWGDRDSVTPRSEQEVILDTVPDARLIVYAGTGHAVHWEQPARVAADLMAFIAELKH